MATIGVDIRSLMTPHRTGVGEYTYELLDALFSFDQTHTYYLFYNAATDVSAYMPDWTRHDHVHTVYTRWPNKVLNAGMHLIGTPTIDQMIRRATGQPQLDYFFSPNIGFTALSQSIPQILTIHDLSFLFFPNCYSLKRRAWHHVVNAKKQAQRATQIIVPSENTKHDVEQYFNIPPDRISVVTPGLSRTFHTNEQSLDAVKKRYTLPEKFILFLGTIEPRKNIQGLLDAFSAYRDAGGDRELIIAGAPGWKCDGIFAAITSTPHAQYIGYVDAADKPALYALADLFVYPSLYEGFGFPVLEAMSQGTAVITSNRSSLPAVVGDAGYLVNPLNSYEITRGMTRLLGDDNLLTSYVVRGKEQAKKFTWRAAAESFLTCVNLSETPQ